MQTAPSFLASSRIVAKCCLASLLPVYILIAPFIVANDSNISFENISRFFTEDIIPSPLRNGEGLSAFWDWFSDLFMTQALPGITNTLVLTQIALVMTGVFALILFPLISEHFFKRTVVALVMAFSLSFAQPLNIFWLTSYCSFGVLPCFLLLLL